MIPKDIKFLEQDNFTDLRGQLNIVFENLKTDKDITLKRSISNKNTFRGMHYQIEDAPQDKIIEVLDGEIVDFLIDMRKKENFKKIYFFKIIKGNTVFIPSHYAHGFYCLTNVTFQYVTIGKYSPQSEIILKLKDEHYKNAGINNTEIIISDKDKSGIKFDDYI